jgi:hypothetical protein
MAKKTIEVKYIKNEINRLLAIDDIPQKGKKELCLILERILSSTGNYEGYIYKSDALEWNRKYY